MTVAPVDYDSRESLTTALTGQHACVSTLGSLAIATQLNLVTAAAQAGVQRFIPSEFGSNTLNDKCRALPVYADKIAVQDALAREADAGRLTYTFVFNGPFLDWGLQIGWLANLKAKSINLYDGGHRPFSTTTLTTIGRAVAGVLAHPAETKNRAVHVHDMALSLKQLSATGKRATGAGDDWTETVVPLDPVFERAWAEVRSANPDPDKFVMPFITVGVWGEGYGCSWERTDNDLLGIKGLTEGELQSLVDGLAAKT